MADSRAKYQSSRRLIPLWEGRSLLIIIGIVLTCISALFLFLPLPFIEQSELRLYDLMLATQSPPQGPALPVIVGIDDESLKTYGQWPWPRSRMAELVKRLRERDAEVIAFDFMMPEPDRTSPDVLLAEQLRDRAVTKAPIASSTVKDVNSQKLADALIGAKTILGCYFDFSGTEKAIGEKAPALPAELVVVGQKGSDADWPVPTGFIRSLPQLTGAAGAEGFTNAQNDVDGVLRRVPLLIKFQNTYYPSLALGALLLGSSDRKLLLTNDSGETKLLWGTRTIPLDRRGNLLLDLRGKRRSFDYISAQDILNGSAQAQNLSGRIVLIGAQAMGLGDLHLVLSGQMLSGLEIHATIIDNILRGAFISRPGWSRGAELCAVLLLGFLSTWLISRTGFILTCIAGAAGTLGSYWGGKTLLISGGLFISPVVPMITSVMITTVLSLLKYGIEVHNVQQRTRDLIEAQDTIIVSMSALTEARDNETGGHILRTKKYVEILARQYAVTTHNREIDEVVIELLAKSAPLHDIGKVGIPDAILRKRDHFIPEEYTIMKSHTLIGAGAIAKAVREAGHPETLDFLHYARQMIESHHERWDGSGYPHGLSGTAIPLAGRLMAVADVYDALRSRRVYKEAIPHDVAKQEILKESGRKFDPDVVKAFIAREKEFMQIAEAFADDDRQENGGAAEDLIDGNHLHLRVSPHNREDFK